MSILLVFSIIVPGVISAQPWSGITEITPNDSDDETFPDSDFESQLIVYNNTLYVVWYTCNNNTTNGNDLDIVIKSYDGSEWSETVEITYKDDAGDDRTPQMTVYNDTLYIVWQTLDDTISNGSDMDIVIRCYDSKVGDINDTNAWSAINELTPKDYSVSGDDDRNPQLCSYNNKLYVVWETTNNLITGGDDRDIVLRCYDSAWGVVQEVTLPEDSYDDMYPYLCVYQNKLWVAWQTQNDSIGDTDEDILIRCYDSPAGDITNDDAWGAVSEITPDKDNATDYYAEDKYPIMNVLDNKLYVLWQTREFFKDGKSSDRDLVMMYYDGVSWSNIIGVTTGNNAYEGHMLLGVGFDFTVYNNKLYLLWQSQPAERHIDSDIFVRSYDGQIFGSVTELTPPSNFESDYYPCIAVYNDKLYAAWQTRDNTTSSGGDSDIVIRSITIQTEIISDHEVEVAYGIVGTLNVDEAELLENLPEGLTDIGIVINVTGSATNAQIIIKYNDSDIPEDYSEASIKMYYWNGTDWNKIDDSGVDTVNNFVWANVSHFTIFAPVAAKISQPTWNPWYLEPDVYSALILMASAIIILVVVIEVLIYRMTLHKGKGKPPIQRKKNKT